MTSNAQKLVHIWRIFYSAGHSTVLEIFSRMRIIIAGAIVYLRQDKYGGTQ